MSRFRRELAVGAALVVLLVVVSITAPRFFAPATLVNLGVDNAKILICAIGMMAVILTGNIDLSVGSVLAVCAYLGGLAVKSGLPPVLLLFLVPVVGALLGALNGWLVVRAQIPAIIATLATMVGLRGALQWATQGRWVLDLPPGYQWLGLGQETGQILIIIAALVVFAVAVYVFGWVAGGRALYAVGADEEAARLVGLRPPQVYFWSFVALGALTGLAACLDAFRFRDVPSSGGLGLELQVIACVVVGGTSINGGRGSLWGTLIGVALLGVIGTVLTFQGINAAWAKAIQGLIILLAVTADGQWRRGGRVDG
ncbi:MAG TPA: ABC transporter permease [Armatimonadetes bacterium]|mgnify:CR=1 FL=1|nr:ABC transporter permease [Armatimonadota bacterium]